LSNKSNSSSKLSKIRRADPQFEREKAQYDHPLPSREYVLQTLAAQGAPLEFGRAWWNCSMCSLSSRSLPAPAGSHGARCAVDAEPARRLADSDKADLVRGRIVGHPDGFGFLVPEEGGVDLFLSAKEMDKVLHGDKAIARVIGIDRKGRPEGKIVEVTERANKHVVGRVVEEHGVRFVVAENKRISQDILLAPPEKGAKKSLKVQSGQVVMIELIEQPSKHSQPIGRLIEVLGNYADPGMEIEIALRKHELPYEFSSARHWARPASCPMPCASRTGRAAKTSPSCPW
jgi:ribonuclease R